MFNLFRNWFNQIIERPKNFKYLNTKEKIKELFFIIIAFWIFVNFAALMIRALFFNLEPILMIINVILGVILKVFKSIFG